MRRLARAAALAAALLAAPARAQQAPGAPAADPARPALRVAPGLLGTDEVRPGWIPVEVELSAGAEDRALEVEVAVAADRERLLRAPAWRVRQRLEVARGQRRRAWVWLPWVERAGCLVATARPVEPGPDGAPQAPVALDGPREFLTEGARGTRFGSWGASPRLLVVGEAIDAREVAWLAAAGNVALGRRAAATLPDRLEAYLDVDLVVLRDVDLSGLSPAQQDALVHWVEVGGRALLVPGRRAGWFGDPVVKRLVGGRTARIVAAEGLRPLLDDAPAEAPFPPAPSLVVLDGAAPVDARRAHDPGPLHARVAVDGGGEAPLLSFVPRGEGRTWLLGVDPGAPPWDRAAGALTLGRQLSALLAEEPGAPRPGGPWDAPYAATTVRVLDAPAWGLVVGLVACYVVLVGPVNHLWLRRRRAPLLLVVSVPAIAAVWTGLVLSVGYATKGSQTITRRVTVLGAALGEPRAMEETWVGVRAAAQGTYEVAFDPALLPGRLHTDGLGTEALVDPSGRTVFPAVPLGLWAQAAFRATALRRLPGGLELTHPWPAELALDNRTGLAIARAVAIHDGAGATFDEVAAGATRRAPARALTAGSPVVDAARALVGDEPARLEQARLALQEAVGGHLLTGKRVVVALLEAPPSAVQVDGRPVEAGLTLLVATDGGPR